MTELIETLCKSLMFPNITTRNFPLSQTHMTELMETLCKSFSDYAQAYHKTTGKLEVISIVGKDGKMNPHFSDYDMVQDPDLNKGLEFHCQSIVEDYEDDILKHFSTVEQDGDVSLSKRQFCAELTSVCPAGKTEL